MKTIAKPTPADWLTARLSGGPAPATDVLRAGAAAGYSARTLKRAKSAIGAGSAKGAFAGSWNWSLAKRATDGEGCQTAKGATGSEEGHVAKGAIEGGQAAKGAIVQPAGGGGSPKGAIVRSAEECQTAKGATGGLAAEVSAVGVVPVSDAADAERLAMVYGDGGAKLCAPLRRFRRFPSLVLSMPSPTPSSSRWPRRGCSPPTSLRPSDPSRFFPTPGHTIRRRPHGR